MKFSSHTPKTILSFLLVIILSIGTISIIANAQDDTPLLGKILSVDEGKVTVAADEFCIPDTEGECTESLGAGVWQKDDSNIFFKDGVVSIGTEESSAGFTLQSGIVQGAGTVSVDFAFGATSSATVTADAGTGADFSSIQVGDTIYLAASGGQENATVSENNGNTLTVDVPIGGFVGPSISKSDEINWGYLPHVIFRVKNSNGEDMITVFEDTIVLNANVTISGDVAVEGNQSTGGNFGVMGETNGDFHVTGNLIVDGDVETEDVKITKLGYWLFNILEEIAEEAKFHTYQECTTAGGEPMDKDGNSTTEDREYSFCRFSSPECPEDWAPYLNWSVTIANTCKKDGSTWCRSDRCTTTVHAWDNLERESCTYRDRWSTLFECKSRTGYCYSNYTKRGCR